MVVADTTGNAAKSDRTVSIGRSSFDKFSSLIADLVPYLRREGPDSILLSCITMQPLGTGLKIGYVELASPSELEMDRRRLSQLDRDRSLDQ